MNVADWWPSGVPEDQRRAWIRPAIMNKWFKVDGIQPTSYISRAERQNKPIRYKRQKHGVREDCIIGPKVYRVLDLVARARGEGKKIEPADELYHERAMDALTLKRYRIEKEIKRFEREVTHTIESSVLSNTLTGKHMVSEQDIVAQAESFENQCGVYFLVKDNRVVYVGQSVHISARLADHSKTKDFDSYAFIRCGKEKLDMLESLYIHALSPEYQGRSGHKGAHIAAPYSFEQLVALGNKK